MKLTEHPEYPTYVQDKEAAEQFRQAVADWRAGGEPIMAEQFSLRWTFERAQVFVRALSHMFQEYNRVLWEQFPHCRGCGGQCCVRGATYLTAFDLIALALLDQAMPTLPERIEPTAHHCIYHTSKGCTWPEEWRPVKCWSYYCALGEPTNIIVAELEWVVLDLLPGPLRRYDEAWVYPLVSYLGDPVDFADALNDALFQILVAPFDDHYAVIDAGAPNFR